MQHELIIELTQISVTHYKDFSYSLLAQLFSKKTLRYCHSPVCIGITGQKTLTFSNISVISEDSYLELRLFVYYQKGNPYQ